MTLLNLPVSKSFFAGCLKGTHKKPDSLFNIFVALIQYVENPSGQDDKCLPNFKKHIFKNVFS